MFFSALMYCLPELSIHAINPFIPVSGTGMSGIDFLDECEKASGNDITVP